MTTATTMTLLKISDLVAEVHAGVGGRVSFQLADGTRFAFDPENGPYVYNGEIVIPIVSDED
jgi:hypothetical protein